MRALVFHGIRIALVLLQCNLLSLITVPTLCKREFAACCRPDDTTAHFAVPMMVTVVGTANLLFVCIVKSVLSRASFVASPQLVVN
jgi:hypothetical protein